eukprot:7311422-Pyramimonas_sp.AAC.1
MVCGSIGIFPCASAGLSAPPVCSRDIRITVSRYCITPTVSESESESESESGYGGATARRNVLGGGGGRTGSTCTTTPPGASKDLASARTLSASGWRQ